MGRFRTVPPHPRRGRGGDRAWQPSRTLYEPSTEHDACGFGFVADIAGRASHQIVRDALTVLVNLEHRGASGSEKNTGDGAGILVALPHGFLGAAAAEAGVALPDRGYGVAMVFLPRDAASREACRQKFEATLASEGLLFLGWRDVPTDPTGLGDSAQGSQPVIAQAFIARPDGLGLTPEDDDLAFERRLYVARRLIEKAVTRSALPGRGEFYIPSMSCRTIVYKGMLNASQLRTFYPDLLDPRFESAIGLVHSRFSTNTFPSWSRAHPYRYISHNGEINTLRGNVNWMFARQSTFRSAVFGDDLQKILPAIDVDGSDTTIFDNVLELLHLSGRSLAHVMMMMVPEPWSRDTTMSAERRAFYEYHSCLMEPWDGPASLAFTDGTRVGATLDRNGLRPGRYYVTKDGRVVMASEAGVLDIPPADVVEKGRLQPGRMFLVDTAQGRIIPDDELKAAITSAQPYEQWVRESLVNLEDLPAPRSVIPPDHETVLRRQEAFGYTAEDVRLIINPMATTGADPIGSMGNDAPLAVLSERPQLLYNYFKQLFAQVTNPPVDAIREEIIMATDRSIGPEANLLEPGPDAAHQVALPSPVISNAELEQIRALDGGPDVARVPDDHAADPVQGERERARACGAPSRTCASARPRRSPRATTRSSSRTAATTRRTRRSRRCSPCRPSTTTSCAPAPAAASACSWSPASRARRTTSACSSGTARPPSTRTSRSRPSTTRSAWARSRVPPRPPSTATARPPRRA